MKIKSEHAIQSEIMLAVSRHGCTIIRTNVGTVKTKDGRLFSAGPPPGWPDLTGVIHDTGQLLLIEVKTKSGRLRPEQKRFAEFITKYVPNAAYGVARSVDDALKIIKKGKEHDRGRMERH